MLLLFSGTGNTHHVASLLATQLGERIVSIPELLRQYPEGTIPLTLSPGEALGLAFPVHAWGPPRIVIEALGRLQLTSATPAPYTYLLCTCGDDCGRTHRIVRRQLRARGIALSAAFSVQMPNTYVCLPGFDTDSPALTRAKLQVAPERINRIAALISNRSHGHQLLHQGSFPRLKSYLLRPLFLRFLTGPSPFAATEACTSCGTCVRACPLSNITLIPPIGSAASLSKEPSPHWSSHCTDCLACYHLCPHAAIRYGHRTRGKGQYHYRPKG